MRIMLYACLYLFMLCCVFHAWLIRIDSGDTERARAPRPRARLVSRWPQGKNAVREARLEVGALAL